MKSLAICIPTYRRPEMLERCILSAIDSAESQSISIFVADDSVADVNRSVMAPICAQYPFVKWHRNVHNLGIDANIQLVASLADSDYVWWIGEDDRFLPGAIANVLQLLQSTSSPFVFSNYEYRDEHHQRSLGAALAGTQTGEMPVDRFIEDNLWAVGFIGGCIVERSAWRATSDRHYLGTYFTHVGRILEIVSTRPTLLISAECAVANRAQGSETFTWKKDSFGVFLGFERMCRIAVERHPEHHDAIVGAIARYRKKIGYFSFKTAVRLRSEGAFDFRQFVAHVSRSDIALWRKLGLLLVAATPVSLLTPFVAAYRARARAMG